MNREDVGGGTLAERIVRKDQERVKGFLSSNTLILSNGSAIFPRSACDGFSPGSLAADGTHFHLPTNDLSVQSDCPYYGRDSCP